MLKRDPRAVARVGTYPFPRLRPVGAVEHVEWEFLFSGLAALQCAFLMIDFFPPGRGRVCGGTQGLLRLVPWQQEPSSACLSLFLPRGDPRPQLHMESGRVLVTCLRIRGSDQVAHGTQELSPDPNTSPALCRNKEWLINKTLKITVTTFTRQV